MEREDKLVDKILQIQQKFKAAEGRSAAQANKFGRFLKIFADFVLNIEIENIIFIYPGSSTAR